MRNHKIMDIKRFAQLEKAVVNAGIGKLAVNTANFPDKVLPDLMKEFSLITAQKPSTRPARRSISSFKLREGVVVGLTATLRGVRMRQFLHRLIAVVIPRVRDFRGVAVKSIDGRGNLTIGFREHIVFPEVNPETSKVGFGLQVTLVPRSAFKDREAAIEAYRAMGIPLEKEKAKKR